MLQVNIHFKWRHFYLEVYINTSTLVNPLFRRHLFYIYFSSNTRTPCWSQVCRTKFLYRKSLFYFVIFIHRWLFNDKLPNFYRQKTHFFSTYFYKRLTAKPKTDRAMKYEKDTNITEAERRHARVKSWTKNVDIFEKDFIFVPINER